MNSSLIGIDEVGRGCWAGPLVAAAVILHRDIPGLNDSKKLSKQRRTELDSLIRACASIGLGWVTPQEVDEMGLTIAVQMAMQRAYDQLDTTSSQVIIDGNYNYLAHIPGTEAVIKADGSIPAVSAASIVAKVARDQYMADLDAKYAHWEFDTHVGYGTAKHISLLKQYGISDIHRRSYKPIKAFL